MPLSTDDVHQAYVDGLNDTTVNEYLEVGQSIQSAESVSRYIQASIESENSVLLGIWIDNNPLHIGTLRIHSCDMVARSGHIGICIFCKDAWGKGLGSKCIKAATRWAFEDLGLDIVEAHCYLENEASIKAFLKAGYSRVANGFKALPYHPQPVEHAVMVSRCVVPPDCSADTGV